MDAKTYFLFVDGLIIIVNQSLYSWALLLRNKSTQLYADFGCKLILYGFDFYANLKAFLITCKILHAFRLKLSFTIRKKLFWGNSNPRPPFGLRPLGLRPTHYPLKIILAYIVKQLENPRPKVYYVHIIEIIVSHRLQ